MSLLVLQVAPPFVLTPLANTLTLKMVQQMIMSAFFAFSLSGNIHLSSQAWYLDSGVSNMKNSSVSVSNVV